MPTTLQSIRDQVILAAEVRGNADFPTARLNKYINLSQRFVQAQLNGLGMKKWETSQDITAGLTAGKYNSGTNNVKKIAVGATYFPNMVESPKSIYHIEVNDSTDYGIAREIDHSCFQEQLRNTLLAPTVKEPSFMRFAGFIWLAPTGVTTATAYYAKVVTDLSADSDVTEIPLEFEEYIVKKAAIDIKSDLGTILDKENQTVALSNQISNDYQKFLSKMDNLNMNQKVDRAKLQ